MKYILILLLLFCSPVFAQEENNHYEALLNSENESDKKQLKKELYQLLDSEEEENWITAFQYFHKLDDRKVADSINVAMVEKFPLGIMARNQDLRKIMGEKDAQSKEALFQTFMETFPPENFKDGSMIYDYGLNSLATTLASAKNSDKAIKYARMVEHPMMSSNTFVQVADILMTNGQRELATELYVETIEKTKDYVDKADPNNEEFAYVKMGLAGFMDKYAGILLEDGNAEKALTYLEKAHEISDEKGKVNLNGRYAKVLTALGREKEAFEKLAESYSHGLATEEMKEDMKALYFTYHENGDYAAYIENLGKQLKSKLQVELAEIMMDEPAPQFSLKDLDGNTVSLASLKGKVVIIDFWATWCGPCIKSFPSMKKAVNRFAENPDVAFLFVHTWETDKDPINSVKQFVSDNDYPFHVLMDLKNEDGKNEVVSAFGISGIPTKIILDKEGNIRFKVSGFSGGEDAAVEEIAMMIDLIG
ncbi:redoxin family protein [Belliella marina]|uniref:Redoxin family protein n=1 Tax=Belliella marina TaxID=1644146 RepID=A0ABW4VQ74_9BACT